MKTNTSVAAHTNAVFTHANRYVSENDLSQEEVVALWLLVGKLGCNTCLSLNREEAERNLGFLFWNLFLKL